MSLERFRRARLVVQHRKTSAHDAARAMEANHVGAILVQDEGELDGIVTDRDLAIRVVGKDLDAEATPLDAVMTHGPFGLPPSANEHDAADLMRAHGIRRVPLLEDGHVVGLVTLDDLLLSGVVDSMLLAEAVRVQLEAPSSRKPAGVVHPTSSRSGRASGEGRAQERFGRLVHSVQYATGLDDRDTAEAALEIVLGAIVRRITYEEAADLMAQLPVRLQERLLDLPKGPDKAIDREFVEAALIARIDLEPEEAERVAHGVGTAIAQFVSEGEIEDVRSQLPKTMRDILPSASP